MTILTQKNQLELEKLKGELSDKNQTKLETLRGELNAKAQKELEELRAKIAEQKTEKDARREYEFEAHKRLYDQCEPLLFQLADLAESALFRIYSLARTARSGDILNWLDGDGYYKRSTLYKLIAPLVILRLFQQRLTFIDLSLDRHIAEQYALLKVLYLAWTDDFTLARAPPVIDYDPNADGWEHLREDLPLKYWPQGFYIGVLDNTIDALLTPEGTSPWMSYGQFESAVSDPTSATYNAFRTFADVLDRFHPHGRPVLWRILVVQSLIYEKIVEGRTAGDSTFRRVVLSSVSPLLPRGSLNWRRHDGEYPEEEAIHTPRRIAVEYLQTRLPSVFGEVLPTNAVYTEV